MDEQLNRRATRGSPFPISLASPKARAMAGQHPTLCSAPATIPVERVRRLASGKDARAAESRSRRAISPASELP